MFYTHKLGDNCDSHILQYHLECIALKQSGFVMLVMHLGQNRQSAHRSDINITILGNVPDYVVS